MPPSTRPRLLADAALLLAAAVWGIGFFFQKSAMAHLGPFAFIGARGVLAAIALAPLGVREHRRSIGRSHAGFARHALGGGITFFGGAALQQAGLEGATITNAGFLTALYVVIVPFVAWLWIGTRPAAVVWPAVVLSAVGTWLLGGGGIAPLSRGDAMITLSSGFWALHVVVTGRAARYERPFTYTAVVFATAGALACGASLGWETTTANALLAAGLDIAYVALLSGALSFTVFTLALEHTPPAEAAVVASTETLFAALAGYVLLDERLTARSWLGAALILLAALTVQVVPATLALRRRRASRSP